jgi:putative transcriptional regulator
MLRLRHPFLITAAWLIAVWLTAALLCAPDAARAQSVKVEDLAAGKLLVAKETDRRFAQTVILLVEYDAQGALGLTINRRTDVPVAEAMQNASGWTDPVFLGGPVEQTTVFALLRSGDKRDGTKTVVDEVHWVTSREVLEKMLSEGPASGASGGKEASTMRVYLGYSGWGAGQLDNEVKLGSWYIFDASADLVFDAEPATLWKRLKDRTEQRFAYQTGSAKLPAR